MAAAMAAAGPTAAPAPTAPAALAAPATATSWEALSKQAQQVEAEIDARLVAFSKVRTQASASSGHPPGGVAGAAAGPAAASGGAADRTSDATALQIEDLLRRLEDLVEVQMARWSNDLGSSASMALAHKLNRHRSILSDCRKEYRKIKGPDGLGGTCDQNAIAAAREHDELVQSVREDIVAYNKTSQRTDTLLSERESLDRSHNMTNEILETVYSAKDNLNRQRAVFTNSQTRLSGLASRFPGISALITKMSTRKKRDNIILASVAAVGVFLIFLYLML